MTAARHSARYLIPIAVVAAVLAASFLVRPTALNGITLVSACSYGAGGAPTITGVNPTTGSTSGGNSVVITGCGFTGATAVHFGATAASAFTVNSDSQVTATAPAHASGTVDVTATTALGTSATQASDQYTYTIRASYASQIDTSTFPLSWMQGVSQTFNVKITNVGIVTWPHSGANPVELDVHFSGFAGGSAEISHWLTSDIFPLSADVAPGGSVTVSVTVTPNFFGHVYLEAELFKNQQFWFDQVTTVGPQWANAFILTTRTTYSATIDTSTFPTTWVKGVPQTFLVTIHNTGTATWVHNGTNPVMLNMHFASFGGGSSQINFWLVSNSFALASDVAPGGTAVVSVTLTPNFFGHEFLEGEMFKNQQFWFDNTAKSGATNPQFYNVFVLVTAT